MTVRDKALFVIPLVPLAAILLAALVAPGLATAKGLPALAVGFGVIFLLNYAGGVHSYLKQTEQFFDLAGSLSFVAATLVALWASGLDLRAMLAAVMILVWTSRLGWFLFRRVRAVGYDTRFADLLHDFRMIFMTWTLQAAWVALTVSCGLVAILSTSSKPIGLVEIAGVAIWATGFAVEVVADQQKQRFRRNPENHGQFIQTGLWSRSQHPNYFGEMTLWVGVAVFALPVLEGWQLLTLASPVFVIYLMMRVSGADMLDAQAEARWGDDPAFRRYRETVPRIVPRLRDHRPLSPRPTRSP
jgi:steroid 5-alpha reductase family enzyme